MWLIWRFWLALTATRSYQWRLVSSVSAAASLLSWSWTHWHDAQSTHVRRVPLVWCVSLSLAYQYTTSSTYFQCIVVLLTLFWRFIALCCQFSSVSLCLCHTDCMQIIVVCTSNGFCVCDFVYLLFLYHCYCPCCRDITALIWHVTHSQSCNFLCDTLTITIQTYQVTCCNWNVYCKWQTSNSCASWALFHYFLTPVNLACFVIAGEDFFQSPFTWDLVGKNLFCLVFLGIFFFILTICIEYQFWYHKLLFLMKRRCDVLFCAITELVCHFGFLEHNWSLAFVARVYTVTP